MEVQKLDHVALYVKDRDGAADFLTEYLGVHVVDHTDRHTLIGAGGRVGKLTLFDAPEGADPSPDVIESITFRVADPESAATGLPDAEPHDGGYRFTGPEGLPLALVQGEGEFTDYDLEGITLRSSAPQDSAQRFAGMGFAPGEDEATVGAGDYLLRLTASSEPEGGQRMLFHLGCLVESAEEHRREAEQKGLEVQDFVDGPNTLAVFVKGPEEVSVEYVEHKPEFSLS